MSSKHFLITGITGFAGPHLANLLLKQGHKVTGLVRHSNGRETDILDIVDTAWFDKINFVYGDLTDARGITNVFRENRFDGVFHLAAQSHPPTSFKDPVGTMMQNVIGSANLIQAIEDTHGLDCKLMFCSTSEVYGNTNKPGELLEENHQLLPANPYGASKAATDLYLQERFTNGKIRGFITRAFSHTGPRRGKTFSISSDAYQLACIIQNLCGETADYFYTARGTSLGNEQQTLRVGNLETVRVVLDVRDIVNAYYLLMMTDKSDGQVFNICGDTPRKMGDYTDLLIDETYRYLKKFDITDVAIKKEIDPKLYRKHDILYQHGDVTKLTSTVDWHPEFDIDETLKDLLQYWVDKINGSTFW